MDRKHWSGALLAPLLLALGACGERIEEAPQASQPGVEINRQGMAGAGEEATAQGVANDTATMGAGPAAPAADDPDDRIAAQVRAALAASPEFGASTKVDVHSEEGAVTLRGRAPDPAARERAADIARTVREVRTVDNLLTLG